MSNENVAARQWVYEGCETSGGWNDAGLALPMYFTMFVARPMPNNGPVTWRPVYDRSGRLVVSHNGADDCVEVTRNNYAVNSLIKGERLQERWDAFAIVCLNSVLSPTEPSFPWHLGWTIPVLWVNPTLLMPNRVPCVRRPYDLKQSIDVVIGLYIKAEREGNTNGQTQGDEAAGPAPEVPGSGAGPAAGADHHEADRAARNAGMDDFGDPVG